MLPDFIHRNKTVLRGTEWVSRPNPHKCCRPRHPLDVDMEDLATDNFSIEPHANISKPLLRQRVTRMDMSAYGLKDRDPSDAYRHLKALAVMRVLPAEPWQMVQYLSSKLSPHRAEHDVRDALVRLVKEGLIVELPDRGFVVKRLSLKNISDLYEVNTIFLECATENLRRAKCPSATNKTPGLYPAANDVGETVRSTSTILVQFTGTLFENIGRSVNDEIMHRIQQINDRLFYVRLCECALLVDVEEELIALSDHYAGNNLDEFEIALSKYKTRRFEILPQLMELL